MGAICFESYSNLIFSWICDHERQHLPGTGFYEINSIIDHPSIEYLAHSAQVWSWWGLLGPNCHLVDRDGTSAMSDWLMLFPGPRAAGTWEEHEIPHWLWREKWAGYQSVCQISHLWTGRSMNCLWTELWTKSPWSGSRFSSWDLFNPGYLNKITK